MIQICGLLHFVLQEFVFKRKNMGLCKHCLEFQLSSFNGQNWPKFCLLKSTNEKTYFFFIIHLFFPRTIMLQYIHTYFSKCHLVLVFFFFFLKGEKEERWKEWWKKGRWKEWEKERMEKYYLVNNTSHQLSNNGMYNIHFSRKVTWSIFWKAICFSTSYLHFKYLKKLFTSGSFFFTSAFIYKVFSKL